MNTTTRLDDQLSGFLLSIAIACVVAMNVVGAKSDADVAATLTAAKTTIVAVAQANGL